MSNPDRQARGRAAERRALDHLRSHGLDLKAAGWRCRLGEIDLVMQHGLELVFIEVRFRQAGSLVSAIDSVDVHKQRRLVRAARAWLAAHPGQASLPARFDVIAIAGEELEWLQNVIEVDGR